jgi:sugar phosphate isomerase/epimerase
VAWRAAFSTLGCAGWPLEDVVALARDEGWQGVELRAAPQEPVSVELTASERADVRRVLAEAGVTPLAVASYVEVDGPGADAEVLDELRAHVALAHDLGAPFVRIFPGGPSQDGAAARRLATVGELLHAYPGVAVCLETHDSCARGADVARVLGAAGGDPQVRAIWDVQHPWLAGEPIEETARALAGRLGYVQICDVTSLDDHTPCPLGSGVIPLDRFRDTLERIGYDGWVSLEWPSYWYPSALPLRDVMPGAKRWLAGDL